jgi:hypothetical protein
VAARGSDSGQNQPPVQAATEPFACTEGDNYLCVYYLLQMLSQITVDTSLLIPFITLGCQVARNYGVGYRRSCIIIDHL